MKNYKVFKHDDGRIEAVKQGWSWPGFFFGIIWALIKKLWAVAGVLFAIGVVSVIISSATQPDYSSYDDSASGVDLIRYLISIGVSVTLGIKGNSFRESSLINNNFQLIGTVIAPNPDMAVAEVMNSQDENDNSNNSNIVI